MHENTQGTPPGTPSVPEPSMPASSDDSARLTKVPQQKNDKFPPILQTLGNFFSIAIATTPETTDFELFCQDVKNSIQDTGQIMQKLEQWLGERSTDDPEFGPYRKCYDEVLGMNQSNATFYACWSISQDPEASVGLDFWRRIQPLLDNNEMYRESLYRMLFQIRDDGIEINLYKQLRVHPNILSVSFFRQIAYVPDLDKPVIDEMILIHDRKDDEAVAALFMPRKRYENPENVFLCMQCLFETLEKIEEDRNQSIVQFVGMSVEFLPLFLTRSSNNQPIIQTPDPPTIVGYLISTVRGEQVRFSTDHGAGKKLSRTLDSKEWSFGEALATCLKAGDKVYLQDKPNRIFSVSVTGLVLVSEDNLRKKILPHSVEQDWASWLRNALGNFTKTPVVEDRIRDAWRACSEEQQPLILWTTTPKIRYIVVMPTNAGYKKGKDQYYFDNLYLDKGKALHDASSSLVEELKDVLLENKYYPDTYRVRMEGLGKIAIDPTITETQHSVADARDVKSQIQTILAYLDGKMPPPEPFKKCESGVTLQELNPVQATPVWLHLAAYMILQENNVVPDMKRPILQVGTNEPRVAFEYKNFENVNSNERWQYIRNVLEMYSKCPRNKIAQVCGMSGDNAPIFFKDDKAQDSNGQKNPEVSRYILRDVPESEQTSIRAYARAWLRTGDRFVVFTGDEPTMQAGAKDRYVYIYFEIGDDKTMYWHLKEDQTDQGVEVSVDTVLHMIVCYAFWRTSHASEAIPTMEQLRIIIQQLLPNSTVNDRFITRFGMDTPGGFVYFFEEHISSMDQGLLSDMFLFDQKTVSLNIYQHLDAFNTIVYETSSKTQLQRVWDELETIRDAVGPNDQKLLSDMFVVDPEMVLPNTYEHRNTGESMIMENEMSSEMQLQGVSNVATSASEWDVAVHRGDVYLLPRMQIKKPASHGVLLPPRCPACHGVRHEHLYALPWHQPRVEARVPKVGQGACRGWGGVGARY